MECDAAIEIALREAVQQSLKNLLVDNARTICERLVASFNNESNIHLLALCYYQSNQSYRSYHILKGQQTPQSRYLFALSCMQMKGKLNEAKEALLRRGNGQVPNGAAGYYLLGKICRLTGRLADAKDHLAHALSLDPMLWAAYEELCSIGGDDQAGSLCSSISASYSSTISALTQRQEHEQEQEEALAHSGAGGEMDAQDFEMGDAVDEEGGGCMGGGSGSDPEGLIHPHSHPSPSLPFTELTPIPLNNQPPQTSSLWSAASSVVVRGGGGGRAPPLNAPLPSVPSFNLDNWATPQPLPQPQGNPNPNPALPPHAHATATVNAGGGGEGGDVNRHPKQGKGVRDLTFSIGPGSGSGSGLAFETPTVLGGGGGGGGGGGRYNPSIHTEDASALPSSLMVGPGGVEGGGGGGMRKKGGGGGGVGKSLFHNDPTPQAALNPHPSASSMMSHGRASGGSSSSVRRSSRLAALAASSASPPRTEMKLHGVPGGSYHSSGYRGGRVKGGGGAGAGGVMISRVVNHQEDSQNHPDPSDPPAMRFDLMHNSDSKIKVAHGPLSTSLMMTRPNHSHHHHHHHPGHLPLPSCQEEGNLDPSSLGRSSSSVITREEGRSLALGSTLLPLMEGIRHLYMYRSKEAMQCLARLPPMQYSTPLVLHLVGRAHLERADYRQALGAFEAARALDRNRVEGAEMHSTALWHLGKEIDLSLLAKEVQETDRLSPSSWCVMGNLSSLQGDHDSAIASFTRATELDPSFAYGHTLRGHEHVAAEDYKAALECYRTAEGIDPRHYNAIYGMGQIYLRQENHEMAMSQFKRACLVNPQSSVLATYLAASMKAQGMNERALAKVDVAIGLDPKNAMARFERSDILMALDRHEEALEELKRMLELTPSEYSVYSSMGKALKQMGDLERAQLALETALGLASSSGATTAEVASIKTMIERLTVGDEQEEDEF